MVKENNRFRCVICSKLRKSEFLEKINNRWVCSSSITGSDNVYIALNGNNYFVHKCKLIFIKNKFDSISRAVTVYNSVLSHIDNPSYPFLASVKIDIPEPTFLLQLLKNIK